MSEKKTTPRTADEIRADIAAVQWEIDDINGRIEDLTNEREPFEPGCAAYSTVIARATPSSAR